MRVDLGFWTSLILPCTLSFTLQRSLVPNGQNIRGEWTLQSTPADSNEDDSSLDDLRQLLEASWNTASMGLVPTSPESAAQEASTAIETALTRDPDTRVLFVDIRLPQYDITAGSKVYDEVLTVEFCVELAKQLESQAEILVRDEQSRRRVQRIFDARKGDASTVTKSAIDDDEDEGERDSSSGNDVESFRKSLIANWSSEEESSPVDDEDVDTVGNQTPTPEPTKNSDYHKFRLASLLGDASQLSAGAQMMNQVVQAVKANALPQEDEDTIIIVSSQDKQELVAIRALLAKYQDSKRFILINTQFDPMPAELATGVLTYSILPLLVQKKDRKADAPDAPSVVMLRRYPRDWEVYVDVNGQGFDLVASTSTTVGNKGPSAEWLAEQVSNYLNALGDR